MMACQFCNSPELKYKPGAGIYVIFSRFVQILLEVHHQDLKTAPVITIERGFRDKTAAIQSFLINEDTGEQRKPASKKRGRHFNQERIVRAFRDKKKAHWTNFRTFLQWNAVVYV